jgi:hypothetical protein
MELVEAVLEPHLGSELATDCWSFLLFSAIPSQAFCRRWNLLPISITAKIGQIWATHIDIVRDLLDGGVRQVWPGTE